MLGPTARPLVAVLTAAAVLAAGCIATTGQRAELDAEQGSGPILIHLALEEGQIRDAKAWWAEDAPEPPDDQPAVPSLEAIVLKNDVVVDRLPLQGSPAEPQLWWNSSLVDAVAVPGDEFEVNVVNATSGDSIASFSVGIQS